MHAFTFDCPACRTRQRLETRFHPGKQYLCPGCNQVIDLTEDDIKSTERSHPLAFRCPECHTVQHAEEYEYLGDVDGWYTTNVRCPGCGKDVTIREETITTYLERQKEGGRAGDRTDGAVPARPPAGKRPAENPWTKIAAERRRASACAVLALVLALAGLFLRFVPGIAEPFRGVRPGDGPAAFIEYVLPDSTVMRDDLSYLASSADARTVRATRMDGTAVTVPFGKFVAWRYRDTDLSGRDDLRTVLVGMPDGTMLELRGIVTATRPVFGTDWPLLDPPVLRIRTADTDWYVAPENAVVTDGR